jgi:hypothetical protein
MDIPTPRGGSSHFEDLYGHADAAVFGKYLFHLATRNFGYPIHAFLGRLTDELARDRAALVALVARNVAKYAAAAAEITSSLRSVLRVRGYFATVYAVGCLAIRYKILPFTEAELLAAVLSCHRDHVAFVDNEVAGGPGWTVAAARAREVVAVGSAPPPAIAGAVVPAQRPFYRLCRYIARNRSLRFIRLRSRFSNFFYRLRRSKGARVDVYIGEHKGQGELWFPSGLFERVAGGAREAAALKQELLTRGILVTDQRGAGVSYVIKRPLPDGSRPFFVVLRSPSSRELGRALARP